MALPSLIMLVGDDCIEIVAKAFYRKNHHLVKTMGIDVVLCYQGVALTAIDPYFLALGSQCKRQVKHTVNENAVF